MVLGTEQIALLDAEISPVPKCYLASCLQNQTCSVQALSFVAIAVNPLICQGEVSYFSSSTRFKWF